MQKIETIDSIIHDSDPINNISASLQLILNFNTIIVYGYGNGFFTLNSFVLEKFKVPISYIFDSKFAGSGNISRRKKRGGNPEHSIKISLQDLKSSQINNKETVVIISLGDSVTRDNIRIDLQAKGFTNIVNCEEIYEWHLHYTPKIFDVSQELKLNYNKINSTYTQLSDQKSKDIYLSMIKFYRSQKICKIKSDSYDKQYIFHLIRGVDTVFDCGANEGESFHRLRLHYGKFDKVFLFEPNVTKIKMLHILKGNELLSGDDISIIESSVSDVATKSNYFGLSGTNSRLVEAPISQFLEYSIVSSTKLDNYQTKSKRSLIKMDIEGGEIKALSGSLDLIQKMRPYLAISIYHKISDLWLIFELLEKFEYKFYIRNYSSYISETILYGIPKDKF